METVNGIDLLLVILGVLGTRFGFAAGRMRERHEQVMRAPAFEQPKHVIVGHVVKDRGPRYVYDVEQDGL